ncbi:MAG: efflux RND transporter permease subunit, partial [Candidatus Hydrogenedentes bacterium]|nr:efflux RND transporter permease subunit [Candidatus Hydrogenedentota bacterium]
MLKRINRFSIANRSFVLAGALVLLSYGLYELVRLPVDVLPDLNRPTVTILTESKGLSPEEVEALVTFPVETVMNGMMGVKRVRSVSGIGLSIIYVEFDWDMPILTARQLVGEKLQLAREKLPEGIQPQMGPISSIMGEIMLIGVSSNDPDRPAMEVRSIAEWVIRPRLLTIPGVAQVIPIGGGRMQYQVKVDPEKLRAYDLTLEEVEQAVAGANMNTTGGFIEKQSEEYLIRNVGRTTRLEDFANAVVTTRDGVPVLVGNVADVVRDIQVKRGDASVNAEPAVILNVQKQPGQDTIALTEAVVKAIEEMRSSLPPDIVINDDLFQQAHFIENSIDNLIEALRLGVILVIIVLGLFLMNFRTSFITITAIPMSFIIATLVFKFLGISINTMTLGGLAVAIGELTDDATIYVENIYRRLRENAARPEEERLHPISVVYDASNEIRGSVIFATMIMCVVFVPLFQLSGIEGRIFLPMGLAYIFAILSSFVVSITLTPALCAFLLPKLAEHKVAKAKSKGTTRTDALDGFLVRWLKTIDRVQLKYSLRHPMVVMGGFVLLGVAALGTASRFGTEFLPPFNEGTVTINLIAAPGTSLSESNRIGTIAEKLIAQVPEVVSVSRRTGRAEMDEHAEGVHYSEIDVDLEESERKREEVLADLRSKLSVIPGVVLNIGQPISHRLDHLLSGVNAQLAVKIFGDDLDLLRAKAEEVRKVMEAVPGVVDLSVEKQVLIPQIRIQMHREAAKRYGIKVGDLAKTLESALYGEVVGLVLDGQKTYDVVVKLQDVYRTDEHAIADILIDTPLGAKVPLKAVADVLLTYGPNQILRENVRRRIVIQCNVAGRDLGSTVEEIQQRVAEQVSMPEGFFTNYSGQFESQQQATRVIGILSLVSFLIAYMLLYKHFGIHRIVIGIMTIVPLAFIGAVVGVLATGGVFSIATLMGFITMTGIAVRNGILQFDHYRHLLREEGETFNEAMVVRGALERLVPVLMTAVTSILGVVPLILAAGEPGKEILYPL